jgi:AcrR family transcriptional regulator
MSRIDETSQSTARARPPTRKQREIAERRELILDAARDLLAEDGFAGLSMDRIAERVQYSKGTIYQHFGCKEDVLVYLSLRGIAAWRAMYDRALGFRGTSRERILAIYLGHDLAARLHPIEYECIYAVRSFGLRDKISDEGRSIQTEGIAGLVGTVMAAVREGVAAGDVRLVAGTTVEEIVYGLWALHYGQLSLASYSFPYQELGIGRRPRARQRTFHRALDGVGWRPLAAEHDYAPVERRILRELFGEEVRRLRAKG